MSCGKNLGGPLIPDIGARLIYFVTRQIVIQILVVYTLVDVTINLEPFESAVVRKTNLFPL